jgi:hypothetical protein
MLHLLARETDDLKVCRMNHSSVDGRVSITDFQYLVGKSGEGISHFSERHELGLFSREEMLGAFSEAGFDARYDEVGIAERGLYIGIKNC